MKKGAFDFSLETLGGLIFFVAITIIIIGITLVILNATK